MDVERHADESVVTLPGAAGDGPASRTALHRAVDARDRRFDGVFFVGIRTTGIYCRPICPSRRADPAHRRFFACAAAAEGAGFRACRRCRPELAPGRAMVDAVSSLARAAAQRIAAGALNGRPVRSLANELGVTERHLRRAVKHELGASPVELAQTHRLQLARRLLAETSLSMTRIAFASGFQSLRRFNAAFRERYGMSPSAIQRSPGRPADDVVALSLPYRPPLAWDALTALLARAAIPGVEVIRERRYARTVCASDQVGILIAEPAGDATLTVRISAALSGALMPLLARLRHLFDLDAEPAVVDAQLAAAGLGTMVRRTPGIRVPGAFDGFETALFAIIAGRSRRIRRRVVEALGAPLRTGVPGLERLTPTVERVVGARPADLMALGVPRIRAEGASHLARLIAEGMLRLEPGADVAATLSALRGIGGVGESLATTIAMRALHWPDAFPASDTVLRCAPGAPDAATWRAHAERWRPWRAYGAVHLWVHGLRDAAAVTSREARSRRPTARRLAGPALS